MPYNFDQIIERRHSDSIKWNNYDQDVLPMWVADMDFRSPEPVLKALHERIDHGVFGYGWPQEEDKQLICDRLARLYDWSVQPEQVIFLSGVVSGFNIACRAVGEPGSGVLLQPPVYHPMLTAPGYHGQTTDFAPLRLSEKDNQLYYEIDFTTFAAAITPKTRLFLLCSPHNPVGRRFSRAELTQMAEICAQHDLVICSDEIHCDLMMADHKHIPTASLSPEIADRCITLMAPSKTFNIPGLGFSVAIVQNRALRAKFQATMAGIVPHVKLLGAVAGLTAYREGDEWLAALLKYLTANRDYLFDYVKENLPGIKTTVPEATYLAWLDCREAGIDGDPQAFFLEKGRVGLNNGAQFGQGGEGFVRLNYGCPRSLLTEGLERMRHALQTGR